MGERALVIRWSAIGDIVMALPVAASIRASGEHQVAWMADKRFVELVDGHPFVAKSFSFDRAKYRKSWILPWLWREQLLAYAATREFSPTVAIDLQGHAKTGLTLKFSRAKVRVALDPKDTLAAKYATHIVRTTTIPHAIDKNLEALRPCGFSARSIRFELQRKQEFNPTGDFVTLHLGTNHPSKQWSIENFAKVAQSLDLPILLVGGLSETDMRDKFFSLGAKATDLIGKLSLRGLSDLLARSSLHVSCDTGSAHIAAAFGSPCVTIFGHMPPEQFHPFNQPNAVVSAEGIIGNVSVEMVLNKIEERLGERRVEQS